MRRQFNQALLPKGPPPKGKNYSKNVNGSDFNRWFRDAIKELGMTIPQFAVVSKYPEATIRRWRKIGNPRKHNQERLAEIFAALNLAPYDTIKATIMRLCDDERPVHKN